MQIIFSKLEYHFNFFQHGKNIIFNLAISAKITYQQKGYSNYVIRRGQYVYSPETEK